MCSICVWSILDMKTGFGLSLHQVTINRTRLSKVQKNPELARQSMRKNSKQETSRMAQEGKASVPSLRA